MLLTLGHTNPAVLSNYYTTLQLGIVNGFHLTNYIHYKQKWAISILDLHHTLYTVANEKQAYLVKLDTGKGR